MRWLYVLGPTSRAGRNPANRSAIAYFIDAVRHNYALGISRYAGALQNASYTDVITETHRLAEPLRSAANATWDHHLEVQLHDPVMSAAQSQALRELAGAVFSSEDQQQALNIARRQLDEARLDDRERGENLLRLMLVAAYATREASGDKPLPSELPMIEDQGAEPSIPMQRTIGRPEQSTTPTAVTTFVISVLFGVFGLIPALMHSSRAHDRGEPTGRYWGAFAGGLICGIGVWAFLVYALIHSMS